jgi:hypothetical protein
VASVQFVLHDVNLPSLEEPTDDDFLGLDELVDDDLASFADFWLDGRATSPATSRMASRAASSATSSTASPGAATSTTKKNCGRDGHQEQASQVVEHRAAT